MMSETRVDSSSIAWCDDTRPCCSEFFPHPSTAAGQLEDSTVTWRCRGSGQRENTILRTQPVSYRGTSNRTMLMVVMLSAWLMVLGCRSEREDPNQPQASQVDEPAVSSVPLRVVVAATHFDATAVNRHWLASSEQAVEFRVVRPQELVDASRLEADVVLYPARLLGELVARQWIVKLPAAMIREQESPRPPASSVEAAAAGDRFLPPPAEQHQTRYGGVNYAVSLGITIPVLISSQRGPWDESTEGIDIDSVLAALATDADSHSMEIVEERVDPEALVDRFLAVVGCCTRRSSKYGILFEMQTMRSRLREPEFVQAVAVLQRLARQPGQGWRSVVGSHTDAWQWVLDADRFVVALIAPALVADRSASAPQADVVPLRGHADFPTTWNTGGGMVASMAAECRQTAHATALLTWLGQTPTRNALAPLVEGVSPTAPLAGADSLAWRAQQQVARAAASNALPREPSLVGAHAFRQALAQELLSAIRGEKSAERALQDAHDAWQQIVDAWGPRLRDRYEESLGLTL
ncbi:MAG: hypothetical protein KatS3mg111_0880 [Pirellulaceae bacterium]|nr:MAG: hypothetical protein KatS3mg111_0880 [Pirellulaceae bacterium]